MTVWAFTLALLRAAPELLALLNSIMNAARSAQDRKAGADAAVKAGLVLAKQAVDKAEEIRQQAEAEHAKHPTDDSGFDDEFRRNT